MLNKLLAVSLLLALAMNGVVYRALNDPETMKANTPACAGNGAFTVLASALMPSKGKHK